jgi:5-oxoprolinase (ATP-hydrolysing)
MGPFARVIPSDAMSWDFWIDRGGTFTDCIGRAPDGAIHIFKLLSSDTAPVEGIRAILERAGAVEKGAALPAANVRLGTTVATNALLERRGAATLLVASRGLGDVLEIGTQERPELFSLQIEKPRPLYERAIEVGGRVSVEGKILEAFDEDEVRRAFADARRSGIDSVAVALIHAYAHPEIEKALLALAVDAGFAYVSCSHEVAREIGLLARSETAVVDAYLTPLLRNHVKELGEALPNSRLRFMQSSGGLTDATRFRGPTALLSGPAGGVVGAARVAAAAGFDRAVGFDMGGTSTDVSLLRAGEVERCFETLVAGVRVKAPMMRVHTVAAGGGSLCRFDGMRMLVGPESASAVPGPIGYGRCDARGKALASELTLTDCNLALGRVQPDRFPFPLVGEPVKRALDAVSERLVEEGHDLDRDGVAAGFVEIANASMAQAIAEVSVARGVDPRDCALVGFGGAAGQHVCAIARELGIQTVLLHPFAGILSAYGIGVADTSWDGQRDAGRVALPPGGEIPDAVHEQLEELEREGRRALTAEGYAAEQLRVEHLLDLRYRGTETALSVLAPDGGDYAAAFATQHQSRFGYTRPGRPIEAATARVRVTAASGTSLESAGVDSIGDPHPPMSEPAALRRERVWFPGAGRVEVPIFERESLAPGAQLRGPAIVLEDTGTIALDPGFAARLRGDGILVLEDESGAARPDPLDLSQPDPIRLEVFGNRFMSIAEQMGAVLRNTSVSTNIKERLDYSCAVFDGSGGLVANAPHIPVHLGAMAETVRHVRAAFPELRPGDVVVTNDPAHGGSHLPDVTAVTPVFCGADAPAFFVASRGHHADIGGLAPGSMPANSRTLEEEGVVLRAFLAVREGRFEEEQLRAELTGARYPARNPDDNVAELEAMVAANRAGVALLEELVAERGCAAVEITMEQIQRATSQKVAREIGRLPDGVHRFADALDDGTPVCVALTIEGERMHIDFAGTGAAVDGNLNAPRAVVQAAVIYVLRTLVAERIPLNGGCLDPVEISIPAGSLLDPPEGAAVVGGNVETSQRIVDVLLGALGKVAASQGTMNNVAFGDANFGYYETIGGGAGAGDGFDGASGVHTHMTNTRITDAEVLEARHPVRLLRFALRRGSGGAGRWKGGDGLERRYEFCAPVTVSLLCERRTIAPWGLAGGEPGARGRNTVERSDGRVEEVAGKATLSIETGDQLLVETPGGGGFGPVK